ncbi:MAG: T9SS type A sorting domain-containing protein, partial [Bacteroidota bacterium]|nr:T9SS type A sorting domain-containing protein [Bacteroidota bacterium]
FIDFPDKKINKIEILSATGQVISTYDIDNNKQIIVKVDELISGIYFIKLSDGESVWIKQFIIY